MNSDAYNDMASRLQALPGDIRKARQDRGLSLRDAAAEAGVAFSTLHRMEHGREYTSSSLLAVLGWLAR